jgi:hypothetical protein
VRANVVGEGHPGDYIPNVGEFKAERR